MAVTEISDQIQQDLIRAKQIASNMNERYMAALEYDVKFKDYHTFSYLLDLIKSLELRMNLGLIDDITLGIYAALILLIGEMIYSKPDLKSTIKWGYFSSMPTPLTQNISFQFSLDVPKGSDKYDLDFSSAVLSSDKFVVIMEPASEPVKTEWFNSNLNKGVLGDSVFADPTVLGGFRFYFSRNIFIFDGSSTVLSLANTDLGNPSNTAFPYTFSYPLS